MHPAILARSARAVWTSIRGRPIDFVLPVVGLPAVFCVGYVVVPYPWALAVRNPERTAVMEQRIREDLRAGDTLEVVHDWVPLEEISRNLVRAVTVAEDYRFREHRPSPTSGPTVTSSGAAAPSPSSSPRISISERIGA